MTSKPRSEERKLKDKEYRRTRKEHYAKLNKEWIKNNKDKYNASKARYRLKLKIEVMRLYSDPIKCAWCGYNDSIDAMVLDHIENDGAEHRRESKISSRSGCSGTRIYEVIRRDGKLDGLQVLCANCNTRKQLIHGRSKSIKDEAILKEIEVIHDSSLT